MAKTLAVLQRLRDHARKAQELELRRAERERDRQQGRIDELHARMESARAELEPGDAHALVAYHNFRLQGEMASRRERARLAQREREVDAIGRRHGQAVRDQLAVENLIERRESARVALEAHAEMAVLDELGARGRRME